MGIWNWAARALYWLAALPGMLQVLRWLEKALGFGEHIEFVTHHFHRLGVVAVILLDPPPELGLAFVILGGLLIWWDLKRSRRAAAPSAAADSRQSIHDRLPLAWLWGRLGEVISPRPLIYDISVKDFLRIGPQYGWDFVATNGWLYLDMQNALVDAAANDLIAVWGREVRRNYPASLLHTVPLVAIPRSHWAAGPNLNIPFNMKGELIERETKTVWSESRDETELYEDLHLAKRQAMRWARGSHAARFKGQQRAESEAKNS